MKKRVCILLCLLVGGVFMARVYSEKNTQSNSLTSALFLNAVEALSFSEIDPDNPGGTCCGAENSSCVVNDVTIKDSYRYDSTGPCPSDSTDTDSESSDDK